MYLFGLESGIDCGTKFSYLESRKITVHLGIALEIL